MSDEDVIRKVNEAVAARDIESAMAHMHPEIVWEHNLGTGSPEEGTYRGREKVGDLFERIIEPWEYVHLIQQEIRETGPSAYHVRGELRAKHSTTSMEVVTPYEQDLEFDEGLLVRSRITTARVS